MRNIFYSSLIALIGIVLVGCSAEKYFNEGDKHYEYLRYSEAIASYEKGIKKDRNLEVLEKMGNAYYFMGKYEKAMELYEECMANKSAADKLNFYYARALMATGKTKEAKGYLTRYLLRHPNDVVAGMLLSSVNSINERYIDTSLFTLEKIPTDDFTGAFSAVEYRDGIVFSGEKEVFRGSKQSPWTGNSYLDLYYMEKDEDGNWLSPEILQGTINGKFHEGPASFSKSGDVVYFTRSNYFKRKMEISNEEENNLKIFIAKSEDGKWKHLEELPFNSDNYSCGHPALASDDKTLYFVSDMPGGYGGTDIYVTRFENGEWTKPENLGETVNTPGNEMFPYMHDDGILYFSSDAHNSMGGLDVFLTYEYNGRWMKPENLNYPLNSLKDDFSFVLSEDNTTGFVTSSRANKDELYEFKKNAPTFILYGRARKKDSFDPVAGVTVEITRGSDGKVITMTSDKDGKFEYQLDVEEEYHLLCTKIGCFTRTDKVSTKGKKYSENFYADFIVEEIELNKPIVLEDIFYDFDRWNIRPDAATELDKLVKLLKDNPTIHIEMGSHCDARGKDHYNQVLSDKRALAAVRYLIYKGIAADRLSWKGYGETVPRNQCVNGVKCSEEQHQENRRTEFKVTKL
ncbi:OmpA family protein [Paracrocinitomix mangrovi]|uniref:OmpA family protein n=1 Tax=Paracrocinitomix mangrovi TaxID=2862509 RepID=UPI001C8DF495|nr:OmpA family protein [Paracrocinitomix mangrovi]UKN02645.1 OmpA family protein [Paracrocinitomix mangrovi]